MSKTRRLFIAPTVVGIGLALASPAHAATIEPVPAAGLMNSDNWVDHAGASLDGGVFPDGAALLDPRHTPLAFGQGISPADPFPLPAMASIVIDVLRVVSELR